MKNEVLVRAITEIDEELIVSAHRSEASKRNRIKYFSAAAAACLLLICGVIFLFHKSGTKPDIAGLGKSDIVFGEPVISAQQSKIATYDLWQTPQSVITVPIEIVSEPKLVITAVDGTITVYSAGTNEQVYEGQRYEANVPVTVEWTIEDPDTEKNYLIEVNNKEKVYMLRYDSTNDVWSITETEE